MSITTYNRRKILRYGAVTAGAMALSAGLPGRSAMASEPVDILIVGGGYSGSVAALRLAEAGFSSVVLERGRRWVITPEGNTFATLEHPDGRLAWLSAMSPFTTEPLPVATGVLEAFPSKGVTVICLAGAGVGGGSLVNNAMMIVPREDLFRASFANAVSYAEMVTNWYPKAKKLIGVEPIPDDVLASPAYSNAREFLAEAHRANLPTQRPGMAIDWQVVREEIAGKAVPSAIRGHSLFGINSGAKRSVDRTIMAAAEATGKVLVKPLHQVIDISAASGRYMVECEQIDEQGRVLSRPRFAARVVFMAAGSLGTSRLLVRAKALGRLPQINDQVGQNWGSSSDHVLVRTGVPLPSLAQGGPAHVIATDWENPDGALTLLSFPLGVPVVGGAAVSRLAVLSPPPAGFFTYNRVTNAVELNWPAHDARIRRLSRAVSRTAERLAVANPGVEVTVETPLLTSHSLGGAVLGNATSDDGEVLGCPNLFVVDGSLIPGSCGSVPPALTVTALADRCITKALHKLTAP